MNIAVLHPQCRVRWWAIKMALISAQSLQNQGHKVIFYTFDHAPECFPELQAGLTIVTSKTTQKTSPQNLEETQSTKYKVQSEGTVGSDRQQTWLRHPELDSGSRWKQTIPSKEMNWDNLDSVSEHGMMRNKVDTVDKDFTFWGVMRTMFPRLSRIISLAWNIRQVDIVIAHNPPMHIVAAFAKMFSLFSGYHQLLTTIWWHHHVPWYYTPKHKGQNTKDNIIALFSLKTWKSLLERYIILPQITHLVATSYYVAFCLEKYCWRKAIVIHPVITAIDQIQSTKDKVQNKGTVPVIPAKDEAREVESRWKQTISSDTGMDSRVKPEDDGKARPVVLFTHGRLEPGKGLDTLVKVWKEVQAQQIQNTKDKVQNGGIKLLIAWEGSLKDWLIEQWADVISYHDGVLDEIQKTKNDILAIYLSTIDAFGMASLEAQIAGLSTIILDRWGARETVLLDSSRHPVAQLIDSESDIATSITYFIQQRALPKRVANVNFCHQRDYFSPSRIDVDIRSLIGLVG